MFVHTYNCCVLLVHWSSTAESVRSVRMTFGTEDDEDSSESESGSEEGQKDDVVEPKKNLGDNEETHL